MLRCADAQLLEEVDHVPNHVPTPEIERLSDIIAATYFGKSRTIIRHSPYKFTLSSLARMVLHKDHKDRVAKYKRVAEYSCHIGVIYACRWIIFPHT